ncbi:hypothetical protein QAD02_015478, partial [Eretmocerus hayati]
DSEVRLTDLDKATAKCNQLQELLQSKDAEIAILRRQNNELQRAVVEYRSKPNDLQTQQHILLHQDHEQHHHQRQRRRSNGSSQDDEGGGFFWDPQPNTTTSGSRGSSKAQIKALQEQLEQAALRIQQLEAENSRRETMNTSNMKDDTNFKEEGPSQKTDILRAKQDVMNRIIQIGEKSREAERNARQLHQDEQTLVNDFRTAVSKLASAEQSELVRSALIALESENERLHTEYKEKSDSEGFDAEGKAGVEAQLRQRIQQLESDNEGLSASIDELDKQHAESIERVLSLKEELQKKHHSLQSAYEHLYVEYSQLQTKLESLQQQQLPDTSSQQVSTTESTDSSAQTSSVSRSDAVVEAVPTIAEKQTETDLDLPTQTQTSSIVTLDKATVTDEQVVPSVPPPSAQSTAQSELTIVEDILKNSPLEETSNEDSLFIRLARQYVELRWRKEAAERKLTEQGQELKETQQLRDSLQLECEDLQQNVESLLVQLQHLKSSLPSIPEASEERVASLESETESLLEKLRISRESQRRLRTELSDIRSSLASSDQQADLVVKLDALILDAEEDEQEEADDRRPIGSDQDDGPALRRRIETLEGELRVSLERCKGLDESIELIEELKLDLDNARRELKIATSNARRLDNSLSALQEAKQELESDNEMLAREKEQLESDLETLRHSAHDATELMEQLRTANADKADLEYDIGNMRRELDAALARAEQLERENERQVKHAEKLAEQLADAQNDSHDKLEMLDTELGLIKQELDVSRKELEDTRIELERLKTEREEHVLKGTELSSFEIDISSLRNEKLEMERTIEKLESQAESLRPELARLESGIASLQKEKLELESVLTIAHTRKAELERELEQLEQRANALKPEISNLEQSISTLRNEKSQLETEKEALSPELASLEVIVSSLRSERLELDTELEQIRGEKEKLEKEIEQLKSQSDVLKSELASLENVSTSLRGEKLQLEAAIEQTQRSTEVSEKILHKTSNEESLQERSSGDGQDASAAKELEQQLRDELEKLKKQTEKDREAAAMARETVDKLSQIICGKDTELTENKAALDALSAERDELVKLVQDKHAESLRYHSEIQRLNQLLAETSARLEAEQRTNAEATRENESQLMWARNELEVAKQRLNEHEASAEPGRCGTPEHAFLGRQVEELGEKSRTIEAAMLQEQSFTRQLREQLAEAQLREAQTLKELERLRSHLVEVEQSHNEEALQSQEIQASLEARLAVAEDKLKNSSSVYTSASVRANQQIETLQQQLALVAQQRDELQNKISAAEDRLLSYTASLTNLQLVLEQFQRDKEKDIQSATEKLRNELQESYKSQDDLKDEISNLKDQLSEAKECLRAASRLTEQLEKKSERIEQLNQEVSKLTELVNTSDQRIQEANKCGEGKVDRSLVKNLLLGYISSPSNDKSSVLRVFANVLDFNDVEREKSGLNSSAAKNSWFSSMVNSSSSSSKEQEASLSSAFVKFLESESQPKPQLPALPISNSSITRPGHSRQHSSSSTQSTLLLTNVALPTFPDFVPARNTGSILKEVLKDS